MCDVFSAFTGLHDIALCQVYKYDCMSCETSRDNVLFYVPVLHYIGTVLYCSVLYCMGAAGGGGGKSWRSPLKNSLKNCRYFGGLLLRFSIYRGPFCYFFLYVEGTFGLAPPPLWKFLRAPKLYCSIRSGVWYCSRAELCDLFFF